MMRSRQPSGSSACCSSSLSGTSPRSSHLHRISSSARPEVAADRRALISGLRTYRVLVGGVLLLAVGTSVVVAPLTRRVMLAISFRGPFPTIQAGLLVIDVMLLALFVVTMWVWVRLGRRIRALRAT